VEGVALPLLDHTTTERRAAELAPRSCCFSEEHGWRPDGARARVRGNGWGNEIRIAAASPPALTAVDGN